MIRSRNVNGIRGAYCKVMLTTEYNKDRTESSDFLIPSSLSANTCIPFLSPVSSPLARTFTQLNSVT